MNKKRSFSQLYVKYIIKTPILFYAFLSFGILIFLYFCLTLKLDNVESAEAEIKNNYVIIDGEYTVCSNVIYLYYDRNEVIYKYFIGSQDNSDEQTIIEVNNNNNLSGKINVDIVVGKQTLFERIFGAGKRR